MATVVVMPQLGNSVESCLIVSWAVSEGDVVAENSVLCEVETDKASMEVPSPAAGTVLKVLWAEGDDVPVKDPLLVLGEPGEDPGPALQVAGAAGHGPTTEVDTPARPSGEASYEETDHAGDSQDAPVETLEVADPAGDQSAVGGPADTTVPGYGSSPRARTLAASTSVDVRDIGSGTGPRGRVIERDVQAVLAAGPTTRAAARAGGSGRSDVVGTGIGGRATAADVRTTRTAVSAPPVSDDGDMGPSTTTPLRGIRKVIASRMMNSLASSAQLTYTTTAGAQGLLDLRKRLKTSDPSFGLNAVTIGDLVGFAAARTAARHTSHNAHLVDGVLTEFERVHMGFACDTPRGLLVPTVRNASLMGLAEFSQASKQLAADAIGGTIAPDLLQGATFTVSNLGGLGIESFTPLLNVPQTAILGVDAIFPRAVIHADGTAGAEQRIGLSLTADHRVIDGADAARFLSDLVAFLEAIDIAVLA
ncbi:dihydrolipoamide acetyltransferase family protein [Tessaracoccus antarcticus]|uniref:Dihydrolipoamide acetyltransferase component of pyruvate dehydrogenase complex n=1 Tax=Tessaracoccus antarcticus TaxID=2479848 RepID=A0A3M0GA64_9ACTN|nr:dihydrolipoamide acetyltransferase family protein [Tessaracoccus antarcticus]RMB61850.1 2-oxo acid dehydrogenase subunit E2 [Tessaracoccus antarcticus]